MVVCICANVCTDAIVRATQAGLSLEEVKTSLCAAQCCKTCEPEVENIYKEFSNDNH